MYLLDAEDSTIPAFKSDVGGARRLDRRRRRRRPVELPRAHRRHRRRDRGRHRGGPAPQHPGHRPARAGRGGAVGARAGRRARADRRTRPRGHGRDRGGRGRRSAKASGACSASLGVQEIVAGGQSMNPSTAQILEAVERCPSDSVIVLPNNKNIVAGRPPGGRADVEVGRGRPHALGGRGARRARRRTTRTPSSTTTSTAMDGAGGAGRRGRGDAGRARHAWPSAGRSARATGSRSVRDGICVATDSAVDAAFALVDALVTDDSEIVTVLVGADARAARDRAGARAGRASRTRSVEVEVHEGGQPLYPYLIGVE